MKKIDKSIPHDNEAEAGIIASIFLDEKYSKIFIADLKPDMFFNYANRILIQGQINLINKDIGVDIVSLRDELKEKFNQINGSEYCYKIIENYPTANNIEYYIDIVKKKYQLRQILSFSQEVSQQICSEGMDLESYLEKQSHLVETITEQSEKTFNLKKAIDNTLNKIEEGKNKGLPSGITKLDKVTGGFSPSDLVIIAGRPGMGKTSLALSFMSNQMYNNKNILFFSLEMNESKIINRLLSMRTNIELWRLKNGTKLNSDDWRKITSEAATLSESNITILDKGNISLSFIRKNAYMYNYEKKIDIIYVDYLQRMKHQNHKSGNRAYEVGNSIVGLKTLAKELDIPVVVLAQLNRELNNRPNPEPRPSDLKESGDIEQEADIILFPWRPSEIDNYKAKKNKWGEYEDPKDNIIIGKNRDGPRGTIDVRWLNNSAQFVNEVNIL